MNFDSLEQDAEGLDVLAIIGIILAIWGLQVAYKNMSENNQQTEMLREHLNYQDENYLKKSVEQNEIIIKQNELIIKQNEELLERGNK